VKDERRRRLRDRIAQHPKGVRFEELRRLLEAYGWTPERPRSGSSHHTFRRPGELPITVPFRRPTVLPVYVRAVLARLAAQDAAEEDDDDD
jgi:predicted RNA binding protein YcfA (HicA-like mRNA interferase family)